MKKDKTKPENTEEVNETEAVETKEEQLQKALKIFAHVKKKL